MHQSRIHVNHLGFLCDAEKIAIVSNPAANEFQVEDLAINDSSTIAGRETFRAVYTGSVEQRQTDMGVYGICDFSRLQKPGIYRLSMPGHEDVLSYQFVIADGVFHALPPAFSNFLCELRSGSHSSYLRQATHFTLWGATRSV